MKHREEILIAILTIALIMVIYLRFGRELPAPVTLGDPEKIIVHDMSDYDSRLADVLAGVPSAYFLFLELDNCPTCLYKGMRDIEALVDAGEPAFVVVVDDWQSEVEGWSEHYPRVPFFRMAKDVFYSQMQAGHLPVLLKLEGTEITSHRFITVN